MSPYRYPTWHPQRSKNRRKIAQKCQKNHHVSLKKIQIVTHYLNAIENENMVLCFSKSARQTWYPERFVIYKPLGPIV